MEQVGIPHIRHLTHPTPQGDNLNEESIITRIRVCAGALSGVRGGRAIASSYGNYSVYNQFATASGSATMSLSPCFVNQGANNVSSFPFATNVAGIIVDGTNTQPVN